MKKLLLFVAGLILSLGMFAQQTLIISEVADPSDDYTARFVELYNATTDTIDLTADNYILYVQVNGEDTSGWAGVALKGTVLPGHTYVIAYDSADFYNAYGFYPNLDNGNVNGNGDDAFFLYKGDTLTGIQIDAYGVGAQDGTGTAWEYTDSHAVRNPDIGTGNPTWTAAEWTITSAGVSDMSPGQHQCDYPPITPTKLAIISVSHNPQYANWEFQVIVQAQDDNGTPGNVSQNTDYTLTSDGTGTLSGTTTGTILAGNNTDTLILSYDVAETFNLTAERTGGDNLANSAPYSMTINPMPTIQVSTTPDSLIFDTNPTATLHDWGIYVFTGAGEPWYVTSYSGDYYMKASNYPSNDTINTWAILPKFSGANNAIAKFSSASYSAVTDELQVKVSTDYPGYGDPAGYTWTDLTFTPPTGGWAWVQSGDLDLSNFGTDFYIAFVFVHPAGSNNTVEVDSMIIYNQSGTTGINQVPSEASFTVYPNPVVNVLYVNDAMGQLDILDNSGRIVKQIAVRGRAAVDVAGLQPGIYFARLTGQNGAVEVRKFIKR